MSWESIKDLSIMKDEFIIIRNIPNRHQTPEEVMDQLENMSECFEEVAEAIREGEVK